MKSILPHHTGRIYLTDGGIETTLIFHHHVDLPYFTAFPLLRHEKGRSLLADYYHSYVRLARRHKVGFILETPTWRASSDWGRKLGFSEQDLQEIQQDAIGLMYDIREKWETPDCPMIVSGCLGPRGDGYTAFTRMSAEAAAEYHSPQIRALRDAGAEIVTALTLNYLEEALGIANAAAALDIPAVISFTTETDGKLPDGHSLREAITAVDSQALRAPIYYMINCAHPTHFQSALEPGAPWLERIRGLRANASCRSHAELDESTDLDIGDPQELATHYRRLGTLFPRLQIFGGCCGTDYRHIEAICHACLASSYHVTV